MKIIGSILCLVAICLAVGIMTGPRLDIWQNIAQWSIFGILLGVGLRLSQGKRKPKDTDEKQNS
jgi:hypothetical protein